MKEHVILASESWCDRKGGGRTRCLAVDTMAFYHDDYMGGGRWREPGTIENLICTFKNDITRYSPAVLQEVVNRFTLILKEDIPQILKRTGVDALRICVVPRAKREESFRDDQKLFRQTITWYAQQALGIEDGTMDIIRHTDTKTTHLSHNNNDGGGNGDKPYKDITNDTCTISENVIGKNILLIDDLYTRSVGIDEDCIQALYDKGAKKVYFYSVGKTIYRKQQQINNFVEDNDLPF